MFPELDLGHYCLAVPDLPQLGVLDWQSVTKRPDLLAEPVRVAVAGSAVPLFVTAIDPELADTAAFCAEYEVGLDASANCVVVAGRRGDVTTMAACLVLASDRADINRTVRKRLDVRKISFAATSDAVTQTSMEYGGITPIGLPQGWPILIDTRVIAQPWLVIGSGLRGSKIAITGAELASWPGAEVLDLAISP